MAQMSDRARLIGPVREATASNDPGKNPCWPTRVSFKHGRNWCHLCGLDGVTQFAAFPLLRDVRDAHRDSRSFKAVSSREFRICSACLAIMQRGCVESVPPPGGPETRDSDT